MRVLICLMLVVGLGRATASELMCFRTPGEAAVQTGLFDDGGYRLEAVRRDALEGREWALVRSCAHPEMPAQWVAAGSVALGRQRAAFARMAVVPRVSIAAAVMHAGSRVTLILQDAAVRVEVEGIALASGSVGDKVKVRILPTSAEASERIAEGTIRGANLVEVEL